jgi:hypothetical protein
MKKIKLNWVRYALGVTILLQIPCIFNGYAHVAHWNEEGNLPRDWSLFFPNYFGAISGGYGFFLILFFVTSLAILCFAPLKKSKK